MQNHSQCVSNRKDHVVPCCSQPPQTSLLPPDNQPVTTQTQCFQQYSVTMETPPMAWMVELNGRKMVNPECCLFRLAVYWKVFYYFPVLVICFIISNVPSMLGRTNIHRHPISKHVFIRWKQIFTVVFRLRAVTYSLLQGGRVGGGTECLAQRASLRARGLPVALLTSSAHSLPRPITEVTWEPERLEMFWWCFSSLKVGEWRPTIFDSNQSEC